MAETALQQLRRLRRRSRLRSTGRWIANHTGVWIVLGGSILIAVGSFVGILIYLREVRGWEVDVDQVVAPVFDGRAIMSLLAASIALAALVASVYGHYRNVRTSDVMLWQACHDRIGELYDMAMDDREISAVLALTADSDGSSTGDARPTEPSSRLHQWLINYLMALEQSVLCLEVMRPASRRAWQKHIQQHLANPMLRAAFFDDNLHYAASDDDPDRSGSWSEDMTRLAVRALPEALIDRWAARKGRPLESASAGQGLWTFLNEELGFREAGSKPLVDLPPELRVERLETGNGAQKDRWQRPLYELLSSDDVRRQIFPVVDDWKEIAAEFRFIVLRRDTDQLVATFSLELDGPIAEIGFAIPLQFRKRGFARAVIATACAEARSRGARTIRANVFQDNAPSIAALKSCDFREFVWMERNV